MAGNTSLSLAYLPAASAFSLRVNGDVSDILGEINL